MEKGSRIIDVIDKAGGLTENANTENVNFVYIISDGQKIIIPKNNDENPELIVTSNPGNNTTSNDFQNSNNLKININTATQTELESISGIGPLTANKIINYRIKNGKFKSLEELKNIEGIGENKYEKIKDEICIR